MIRALLLFVAACTTPPDHAQCAPGWYVEGVRPTGVTTCVYAPPGGCGDAAGTPAEQMACVYEERRYAIAVYCTNGTHPIVVDERTVGCQR